MNQNKNVVSFTIGATLMLLMYSIYAKQTGRDPLALQNVNLIADLIHLPRPPASAVLKPAPIALHIRDTSHRARSLDEYYLPHRYTNFSTDDRQTALPQLVHKLHVLKQGKKTKVRIAWLGDSMIEGDLLTQTFRRLMQQEFGACGVGFVPIKSVSAANRITVTTKPEGPWDDESFKSDQLQAPLYLSGHSFYTTGGSISMTDATLKDTTQPLEKALLCGYADHSFSLQVNGAERQCAAPQKFNRIVLDRSKNRSIHIDFGDAKVPVYGISFEPVSGVVVDNFSFRGITGVELKKLDTGLLRIIDRQDYYDLIVLEYGVNLMFKKEDKEYSYYRKIMEKVLPRMHAAMPNTAFLLIGTTDRAFFYDGEWKTAIGIDSLVHTQAKLAYDNNMTFYNMYESMGGYGTMVNWATATPALANLDYVHPNRPGAEKLGTMLFNDFMKDYNKAAAQDTAKNTLN